MNDETKYAIRLGGITIAWCVGISAAVAEMNRWRGATVEVVSES